MVMRQQAQRKDLEAQENRRSGLQQETESKITSFRSLMRKLSYFNPATAELLRGNSKVALIRQQTTLKIKVKEAHDLIELIQCLKIDAELNHKLLGEEEKEQETERQAKIRQEVEARDSKLIKRLWRMQLNLHTVFKGACRTQS